MQIGQRFARGLGGDAVEMTCVIGSERRVQCATQRQANPPTKRDVMIDGVMTVCGRWVTGVLAKGAPTCPRCSERLRLTVEQDG